MAFRCRIRYSGVESPSNRSGMEGISYDTAAFNRWNDERNVNVNQNDNKWNDYWWFADVRNSHYFSPVKFLSWRGSFVSGVVLANRRASFRFH